MNNEEELAQDRSGWRQLVVLAPKSLVEVNKEERKKGNKSYRNRYTAGTHIIAMRFIVVSD